MCEHPLWSLDPETLTGQIHATFLCRDLEGREHATVQASNLATAINLLPFVRAQLECLARLVPSANPLRKTFARHKRELELALAGDVDAARSARDVAGPLLLGLEEGFLREPDTLACAKLARDQDPSAWTETVGKLAGRPLLIPGSPGETVSLSLTQNALRWLRRRAG